MLKRYICDAKKPFLKPKTFLRENWVSKIEYIEFRYPIPKKVFFHLGILDLAETR